MRLVLFDIDGTLLDCGGQPRPLLGRALAEVYGTAGAIDDYDFAGKTDDGIVGDLLVGAGLSEGEVSKGIDRAKRRYLLDLEDRLDPRRMRLLPGVASTLDSLLGRPDLELGLLTGNWEGGARIKLGRFGLNRFFRFGAFGDGHRDRADLPPVALRRARRSLGRSFSPSRVVIVGDTPHDVRCARAHGIPALAVATGRHTRRELAEAGADRVAAGLEEAVSYLA